MEERRAQAAFLGLLAGPTSRAPRRRREGMGEGEGGGNGGGGGVPPPTGEPADRPAFQAGGGGRRGRVPGPCDISRFIAGGWEIAESAFPLL